MSTQLDARLKTALDESRFLTLGAQVLFGFAFQGAFRDLSYQLTPLAKAMHCVGLLLLSVSVAGLILPSMYRQFGCGGRSAHRALSGSFILSLGGAGASAGLFLGAWYAFPIASPPKE